LCADLVVLNKADLLDDAGVTTLIGEIRSAIPRAVKIVPAREGKVPIDVLLGLHSAAEDDISARPSCHDDEPEHDHDDFESFIVDVGPIAAPADLAARAQKAAALHDVLRIKGFAAVDGKPMRLLLQGVGGRVETRYERPWTPNEPRVGRLVVIGQKGLQRDQIAALLQGSDSLRGRD
jgi:cobalamin biosynthesis protein CobW